MIYTVTLNPSLDYMMHLEELNLGAIHRASAEGMYPGGKGINVSVVLSALGVDNLAIGVIAGFTGREIERLLIQQGCKIDFIYEESGYSRINVKVRAERETDINSMGPSISNKTMEELHKKLSKLKTGDVLVLAGSIPGSLPFSTYEELLLRLKGRGILTVVDATGELLLRVLPYRPFLIKPNEQELGELFHVTLSSQEEIVRYAKKLQDLGARNVLVSMAEKGALLIDERGNQWFREAPKGNVINSVGAGDSMVAGFLAGYFEKNSYENALALGIAAGSASAFSEWLPRKEDIIHLFKELS